MLWNVNFVACLTLRIETKIPVRLSTCLRAKIQEGDFVRLLPRSIRGGRQCIELQTSVTTFERELKDGQRECVQLHAQIHFGTRNYFDYYNKELTCDTVHYELLVDEELVEDRTLKYPQLLTVSPADQQMALQYGLICQVDAVDYSSPNWIHADFTRQEFLNQAIGTNINPSTTQPLWALASSSATWPGTDAALAIFKPPKRLTTSQLSNHSLIVGATIIIRILFWMLVPAPELSVLLLDWSKSQPLFGISPMALPVLELLVSGKFLAARQLLFAQVLVSGQLEENGNELLIKRRNNLAMEIMLKTLELDNSTKGSVKSTALLYGAGHCPNLYQQLCAKGFIAKEICWRTAWSVFVPSFGRTNGMVSSNSMVIGLVIVPLYFLLGGFDWILTWQIILKDLILTQDLWDASVVEISYLIRHVALYLVFAKFIVRDRASIDLFNESNKQ
mmetsp:Transcript_4846/g.5615  ORF Transcript_4846/g.5615 Transcript_4846/m.5615 type:complete len:447 (+) Transcript_4846:182-1522(+)